MKKYGFKNGQNIYTVVCNIFVSRGNVHEHDLLVLPIPGSKGKEKN
jgi:hypothetical protein